MRRSTAAIGAGAVGASVWGLTRVLRRGQHVRLRMEQPTALPADVIIGRVADISSEPALIPFVDSVDVLSRSTEQAEYILRGCTLRIPWCVHYSKQWDYGANMATWRSVDGSYGIDNAGRLDVVSGKEGNIIKLSTGYSVNMPVVGRFAERMARPFLAYAFGVWLKRLSM